MSTVQCPVCSTKYTHIESIVVNKEAQSVTMQFWCENGWHSWQLSYTFDEGITSVSVIELPNKVIDPDAIEAPLRDFWDQ